MNLELTISSRFNFRYDPSSDFVSILVLTPLYVRIIPILDSFVTPLQMKMKFGKV